MSLKPIRNLIIPENDAENFIKRDKKEIFNSMFIAKDKLDAILDSNRYFLIGEKGTGKTAYSVYLSNNNYKNTFSRVKYIRETEYVKFIEMKKSKNLQLSDYESVWKVLLLLLVSQEIHNVCRDNIINSVRNYLHYKKIKKLIDDFTDNAFKPELINAMKLIDNEEFLLKIGYGKGDFQAKENQQKEYNETYFNIALLKLEDEFKKAFKDIKISKNYVVFIDGIDIRPSSISQEDYIECLKGLTNAIWSLNQDFFGNLRDKKGNIIKVMLLIRPDIYMKMDLQNQATKIYNNSIVLNWLTTYKDYKTSSLFKLVDRILSYDQEDGPQELGYYFDKYFPYKLRSGNGSRDDSAFIGFLRYSFYRARDIVTLLGLMKENVKDGRKEFTEKDFRKVLFKFSQYLLMEVRDYFKFYYEDHDFDFLRNFLLLFHDNVEFDLELFEDKYNTYLEGSTEIPMYAKSYKDLLQFLFELNVVGYVDKFDTGEIRGHWCFRERDMSNPVPKINFHADEYRIHHGLHAALRIKE